MNDPVIISAAALWLLLAAAFVATLATSLLGAWHANREVQSEQLLRARMTLYALLCLILDLGVVVAAWQLGEPSFARSLILVGFLPYSLWMLGFPLALAHFSSEK